MAEPTKELFKFAFFSKFEENISFLSKLADPEKWDFGTNKNNSILKNYLEYTFRKLQDEKKIIYTTDNQFCCFNTGLVTSKLEEIFSFFDFMIKSILSIFKFLQAFKNSPDISTSVLPSKYFS